MQPRESAPELLFQSLQPCDLKGIGKASALREAQQDIEFLVPLKQAEHLVGHFKSLSNIWWFDRMTLSKVPVA